MSYELSDAEVEALPGRDAAMPTDKKPCGQCGRVRYNEKGELCQYGLDPCIGLLDGVYALCCGHGYDVLAYVWGNDGSRDFEIRGEDAVEWLTLRGVGPRTPTSNHPWTP